MKIKVCDYIVKYLIKNGITDVFGYPGGMVTHLLNSFDKYKKRINAHLVYHEQAASFAACGYAQTTGKIGVAYATSGPGATNLVTGICQAYFDSIPVLFITGQVNTNEIKKKKSVRQYGFQETEITKIVSSITKMAIQIRKADEIKYYLDKSFCVMRDGRKGPVLLDIPMNVLNSFVETDNLRSYNAAIRKSFVLNERQRKKIERLIKTSERPLILVGNGFKFSNNRKKYEKIIKKSRIPLVTSMISFDVLNDYEGNYGFIGAYGNRAANFIASKADLIISIGSRLDIRQVGKSRKQFAKEASIIRIDIDENEFFYKLHSNDVNLAYDIEKDYNDIKELLFSNNNVSKKWISVCNEIRDKLSNIDVNKPLDIIKGISLKFDCNSVITTDVGQNQVWCAQAIKISNNQKVLFSGSEGSMGYSLPAAIGAYYGSKKPVYCFCGDGGFQMNIQELEFVRRENIPIKIIVINNESLGLIRQFQEVYFYKNYMHTTKDSGYTVPSFKRIATAYGIRYREIGKFDSEELLDSNPLLLEYKTKMPTYVKPKLLFGEPNNDQIPKIDRKLYNYLKEL